MIENKSMMSRVRVTITYIIVLLLTLLCLFPLWNVVCISFSDAAEVMANHVYLTPVKFTTKAYSQILEDAQFWRSFCFSILRVVCGLAINLFMIVFLAFPLSKTKEEFRGRNLCMGFFVFAMLFSGGMIPTYLTVKNLKLLNTVWALVLPGAVPVANVIMTMNFFAGIPKSLEEAAIMDGASPLKVLLRIYLPCSKPSMATMALFSIVGHWNDFYAGLLYMTKVEKYPVMSYIQSLQLQLSKSIEVNMDPDIMRELMAVTGKNLNAAKVVVSTVPLLLVYPFLQKYLISGIVMGAVKE